jgi:RNA polymerase sigma-70 factor, ECF subfamily
MTNPMQSASERRARAGAREAGDDTAADPALVARWLGGDERAATLLVERHAAALARFAVSLGVRRDVDEIVQDTFVRAFNALQDFRGESSLRSWLFTIERRLVLDRRRSERRRRDEEEITEGDAATEVTALDGLVAAETERRVHAAVGALTPMQRQIFSLRVTEGLSYKEIATVVGTTEGAARVHYFNAVRGIKERLDG